MTPHEDLLNRIQQSGQSWSQYDLDTAKNNLAFGNTIFSAKSDWAKAHAAGDQAGMAAANAAAENARRTYGSYLGGSEGSQYYGLGGPASYQSPYSGAQSDTLNKMQNYGSFSFDQEKPSYQNTYGGLLDEALKKMQNYGSFSYGSAPTYQNRYQEQIDSLLKEVQGYGPFTWSKETDPAYSAYAKQYRREGDRATANALAQAAAATGGQVSTAAMTAASQAGDYYAGQLADKIPELYENAYQRYLNDYSLLTNKLGQTQQTEQNEYAKYLDQLGQFNTDRALSYDQWLQGYNMLSDQAGQLRNAGALDLQRYQTELDQYNNDRNFAYGQYADDFNRLGAVLDAYRQQDETGYNRYLDQVGYNTSQDQTAYEREMQAAQLRRQQQEQAAELARNQVDAMLSAGVRPSDSLVAGSGYQGEYVQALENYYRQQAAQVAAGGRSGGSGGSGRSGSASSGGGKPNLTWPQTLKQIEDGNLTPSVLAAYEYYMGEAYREEEETAQSGGTSVTSSSQLGKTARAIYDGMVRGSGSMGKTGQASGNPSAFLDRIEKSLASGAITEAEADYLLSLQGL